MTEGDREEAAALSDADRKLCEALLRKAAIAVMETWPAYRNADRDEIVAQIDGDWSAWRGDWVADAALIALAELSRQLAAAEADAARLAEAVEELQATPPHWEEYADVYNMAEAALAAHTARLIDG